MKKENPISFANGVRGIAAGKERLYVGATAKPIAETRMLPISAQRKLSRMVEVDEDLSAKFPDAAAVNSALRLFLEMTDR
ncbi:MAG: hypothetical protein MSG64_05205 [Pyrinomonadaceae bacterium MAG19_C2-C3]|nr:hypothetical protein [Pyrinomonadaceae bacterium MAG19_C2-C3]